MMAAVTTLGGPGSGNFGHAGRPGEVGGSAPSALSDVVDRFSPDKVHLNAGPLTVRAYRVGATEDRGRGVFFGGDAGSIEPYASLHEGHQVKEYVLDVKNAAVAKHVFQLHPALFKGKTFQDAVYDVEKRTGFKSSIEAARKVEAKIARELKRLGHDAVVYTQPPAPAKAEIAVFDTSASIKALAAARLLVTAARRAGTLAVLGGPGSGNFGHAGRPGQVGGSAPGIAIADFGTHDLPSFDENDADSPEWKVLLAHDDFLDRLEEGADAGDDDMAKMNDALDVYTHTPEGINDALRQNPDLMDEADDEGEENEYDVSGDRPQSLGETAREIENAMADAPKIKTPVTVYRGLRGVTVGQLVTAERLTMNGFQSTSFDPRVAASFMGEKSGGLTTGKGLDGVLLKIEAKYGLAFGHAHSIDGEMEMLLPHADSYDVVGVSKVNHAGGTFPMVHLRQR